MLYDPDPTSNEESPHCIRDKARRHKRSPGVMVVSSGVKSREPGDMVQMERGCLADPNYLTLVQKNRITARMRRLTLDWVFELIDTTPPRQGQPDSLHVFPGACSIFDRYLSYQVVDPADLQDVALSALLCASKILSDTPLTISAMENYYRFNKLKLIEEQFLNTLQLREQVLVLPTDYFAHYTHRLTEQYGEGVVEDVVYHAYSLLPVFHLEYESVLHPPSVVAGACILEAVSRLLGEMECLETLRHIVLQTNLHPSYFVKATKDIRQWVRKLLDE